MKGKASCSRSYTYVSRSYTNCLFACNVTIFSQSVDDPCLEVNYKTLDQWQRSVKNTGVNGTICDNMLQPGWYRPISLAGSMMPTQCQEGGFTCGTINTLWMNGRN